MVTLAKYLFGVVAALIVLALYHIDPAFAQEAPEAGCGGRRSCTNAETRAIRRGC